MNELEQKVRADLQANLLDGDKVEESGDAMISAEEVFRWGVDLLASYTTELREGIKNLEKGDEYLGTSIGAYTYNLAVEDVLALLDSEK